MDLATLFGMLLAWGAVIFTMWHVSEGALMTYLKPTEMFLVGWYRLLAASPARPACCWRGW